MSKTVSDKQSMKERLYDFIEENFRQMQMARADNGWTYIYLAHYDTQGRAVVQIRDNENGQFGFQLFVPATFKRSGKAKFESTITHLERLADAYVEEVNRSDGSS